MARGTLANDAVAALAEGVYNVTVSATDAANNTGTEANPDELEIDLTAPVVSVTALVTNDTTPELTGLVDDVNATVSVNVDGSDYVATNNGNGTWTLANDVVAALAEGIYNVTVSATDAAGNVGTEANPDELEIDLTLPVISVNDLVTNDNTPALTGTVDDLNASVSVTVDGDTYAAVNNGDGTWTLADKHDCSCACRRDLQCDCNSPG